MNGLWRRATRGIEAWRFGSVPIRSAGPTTICAHSAATRSWRPAWPRRATAGFTGIELGHKFPRDAAALRPVLDAHGLALVSGWYSAALLQRDAAAELAAMRPHLALLKALGCSGADPG